MADSRLITPLPKPLQLRDYLMDDMSSCSSNGFKSFPRRSHCCTTVRFLHEFDRKVYLTFNTPPPPKPALSALQTVIAAVKRLQFTPEKKKLSISFLPRSFSKKILRKTTSWRRKAERKEIVRWKSFDQLLKEDPAPSERSITTTSKRWSGNDFTASDSGNSSSEVNLNLPDEEVVTMPMEVVSVNGVGATNGDVSADSTTCTNESADSNSKKQWSSDEKEQFSPVSVLDCPFDDEEDEEVSSPFQHRLDRMEGTKKKLLKKIQMFECLAKLEPVNLNTRFALQPDLDTEEEHEDEEEDEEKEEEEDKALALLHQTKANMPSYAVKLKADKLLLDFFREEGLIEEAEDWINGRKTQGPFMEWGVQKNRESFVIDMEKGREWKSLDQETEEVVIEVENDLFDALLNEELLQLTI